MNLFAYVGGNPVNFHDPYGLFEIFGLTPGEWVQATKDAWRDGDIKSAASRGVNDYWDCLKAQYRSDWEVTVGLSSAASALPWGAGLLKAVDVKDRPPVRVEVSFEDFHGFNLAYHVGTPVALTGASGEKNGQLLITKVTELRSLFGNSRPGKADG